MSAIALPFRRKRDKTHKIGLLGKIKLFGFKLTFGHIGGLAAIGGYFFVLQLLHGQHTTVGNAAVTLPDVKWAWDHLLDQIIPIQSASQWHTTRHLVRPLYEGIFGGLLYAFIAYNPFKAKVKDTPGRLSQLAIKSRFIPTNYRPVTPLQIVALPLTITLFSIPGVAVGYGVDQLLHTILHTHSLAPALGAHPSIEQKFYTSAFDAKIIGIFGSIFFAGRVARPVFGFTLRYFAQRRALAGKKARFYHPPAFKLLVRDYSTEAVKAFAVGKTSAAEQAQGKHGRLVHVLIPATSFFVLGLAGLGYYVMQYIAKG